MSNTVLDINEEKTFETKKYISKIKSERNRKKAFISLIAIEALKNFAINEEIETNSGNSLSSIPMLLENFDIADILLNNKKVDIRTTVSETCEDLLIPRNHVFYGFTPDIYIASKINKELSKVEFIGFITKSEITNFKGDKNYIIIENTHLKPMSELKNTLESIKTTTHFSIPSEHEKATKLFIDFIDDTISSSDREFFIRHISKCPKCRKNFNTFFQFENKIRKIKDKNNLNLIQDSTIQQVETTPENTEIETPQAFIATPLMPTGIIETLEPEDETSSLHNQDIPEYNNESNRITEYTENTELNDIESNNLINEFNDTANEETSVETISELTTEETLDLDTTLIHEAETLTDINENISEITLVEESAPEVDNLTEQINDEINSTALFDFNSDLDLPSIENLDFNDEVYLEEDGYESFDFNKIDLNEIHLSDDELAEIENNFNNLDEINEIPGEFLNEYNDDTVEAIGRNIKLDKEEQISIEMESCDEDCRNNLTMEFLETETPDLNEEFLIENNYNNKKHSTNEELTANTEDTETDEDISQSVNDILSSLDFVEIFEIDSLNLMGNEEQTSEKPTETSSDNLNMFLFNDEKPEETIISPNLSEDTPKTTDFNDENTITKQLTNETNIPKNSPAKKIAAIITAAGILTACVTLGTMYIKNNQNNFSNNNSTTTTLPVPPQTDLPMNTNQEIGQLPTNQPQLPTGVQNPDVSISPMTQSPLVTANTNNTLNNTIDNTANNTLTTDVKTNLNKSQIDSIKWEVNDTLAKNSRLKGYLLLSSQMLKFSISKSIRNVKDKALNQKIKLMLVFDLGGNLRYSAIRQSSGSQEIDKLVLKTIKDNFTSSKMPRIKVNKEYIKINCIVTF